MSWPTPCVYCVTRRQHEQNDIGRSLEADMKRDTNADEKFEWDMTAVLLLVIAIVVLLVIVMSVWPLGHRT